MVADPTLGFNLTSIGVMTSIFPMAYGVSKFLAGGLGARSTGPYRAAANCLIEMPFGGGLSVAKLA